MSGSLTIDDLLEAQKHGDRDMDGNIMTPPTTDGKGPDIPMSNIVEEVNKAITDNIYSGRHPHAMARAAIKATIEHLRDHVSGEMADAGYQSALIWKPREVFAAMLNAALQEIGD